MIKQITLTKGAFATVDAADYEWLTQWKWHFDDRYACRGTFSPQRRTIKMHREIIKPPEGLCIDHINGDKLDNRRSNLRVCTVSQNSRNYSKDKSSGFHSKYKGVTIVKTNGRWQSRIYVDGKRLTLGTFGTELEAAIAYDEAAIKYFGEFADTNGLIKDATSNMEKK